MADFTINLAPITLNSRDWTIIAMATHLDYHGETRPTATYATVRNLYVEQHNKDGRTLVYATLEFETTHIPNEILKTTTGYILAPHENPKNAIIKCAGAIGAPQLADIVLEKIPPEELIK